MISLNVIVLNEAKTLPSFLEKAKPYVDEIVAVVDTATVDNSAEIIRKAGGRVIMADWNDSYSEHRNFALDRSIGDWILTLDVDEEMSPEMAYSLRELVKSKEYDAYCFPRIDVVWKPPTPDIQIRFFRRGKARWRGRVHESPIIRGRVKTVNTPIIHHQLWILGSPEEQKKRNEKYRFLERLDSYEGRQHQPLEEPLEEFLQRRA